MTGYIYECLYFFHVSQNEILLLIKTNLYVYVSPVTEVIK